MLFAPVRWEPRANWDPGPAAARDTRAATESNQFPSAEEMAVLSIPLDGRSSATWTRPPFLLHRWHNKNGPPRSGDRVADEHDDDEAMTDVRNQATNGLAAS